MNRINKVLEEKKDILSIYFTAGFPKIDNTEEIIIQLSNCDVDMVEIGLPFSDPLADGPTIQESSTIALNNGMNSIKLFEQLKDIRKKTNIPLIIMGYFNPILQFGVEEFCKNCQTVGIDGLIIPDLPVEVYEKEYKYVFDKHGLLNMFLITPQTSNERIQFIDIFNILAHAIAQSVKKVHLGIPFLIVKLIVVGNLGFLSIAFK